MVIYRKIRDPHENDLKRVVRIRDVHIVASVAAVITRPRRTPGVTSVALRSHPFTGVFRPGVAPRGTGGGFR
jgi:hypothetical protein